MASLDLYGPFSWVQQRGELGMFPNEVHGWTIGDFGKAGVVQVMAHPWQLNNHQALRVENLATNYARTGDLVISFDVRNVGTSALSGYSFWTSWVRP